MAWIPILSITLGLIAYLETRTRRRRLADLLESLERVTELAASAPAGPAREAWGATLALQRFRALSLAADGTYRWDAFWRSLLLIVGSCVLPFALFALVLNVYENADAGAFAALLNWSTLGPWISLIICVVLIATGLAAPTLRKNMRTRERAIQKEADSQLEFILLDSRVDDLIRELSAVEGSDDAMGLPRRRDGSTRDAHPRATRWFHRARKSK